MKSNISRLIVLIFAVFFVAIGFGYACSNSVKAADDQEDIEKDIDKVEDKIEKEQKELEQSQANLSVTQSQINTTATKINKTETEISRKEKELDNLKKKIDLNKKILTAYTQEMYFTDQDLGGVLSLGEESFNKYFQSFDQALNAKERVLFIMKEIKEDKEKTEEVKEELAEKKEEHEKLLAQKQAEKNVIVLDINETKASISKLKAKLSELRSDLSRILGKSYDTGEIKDAIKFASKVTGVREGFIFGMLSMESGGNPLAGKCTLKDADMTKTREDYFEKICDDLDFSSSKCKKMPLSCASKSYPGSGGAMGAAQFMSDTWWGYRSRIAKATGHNPPDPWSLIDGVTAMALKLENDGAAEDGKVRITNPCDGKKVKVKWEIYASMRYLGWTCYAYTNYAPGVQNLANGYDDL